MWIAGVCVPLQRLLLSSQSFCRPLRHASLRICLPEKWLDYTVKCFYISLYCVLGVSLTAAPCFLLCFSIYVIDLGSVHGTFVANERLTKDNPVELEIGQSLRFAASTRTYILRKNTAAFFPTHSLPSDVSLPSPPDPNDEDAVVAYNTILNRYGISKSDMSSSSKRSMGDASGANDDNQTVGRSLKRSKKLRVSFRDQVGGELIQVVGISDGADVETEPGPIGVKEGSLVGKYESLVQVTVIPKGKEQSSPKESASSSGVTDKLQQVLNKVKSTTRGGIYDDLYGDSVPAKLGSSWAYKSDDQSEKVKAVDEKKSSGNVDTNSADDSDDLFGDL